MPIYEYGCPKCGKTSSFLVRNTQTHRPPACPHCGKAKMRRALSRFAAPGTKKNAAPSDGGAAGAPEDGGGAPDLAGMEAALGGLDGDDPRAMGRAMRQLAGQSGEQLDPEMDEVVRRLESGEDPEKIEEQLGDAGGEGGSGGGDDTLYDG
jgi:putative FmdB family regulatory protein